MNNQARYIIQAFLFLFLSVIGISFFKIIFSTKQNTDESTPAISVQQVPVPLSLEQIKGQALFRSNCAACHSLDADQTGPSLRNVLSRDHYNNDVEKLLHWIKNTTTLVQTDSYYKSLREKFNGVVMPSIMIADEDLRAIIDYLDQDLPPRVIAEK